MFPHFIFISYIVMIFIGLQGISLVAIIVKTNSNNRTRLFNVNKNLILVSLGLGVLYFITYYSDIVIGNYSTSRLYRLFDGMIFYALGLSWIKVLDSFADASGEKLIKLSRITNIIFFPLMVISSTVYCFLIDNFYKAVNSLADSIMVIFELALVFAVLLFTIIYIKKCDLKSLDRTSRNYIRSVSLLVNIINIWNSLVVLAIFADFIHVSLLSTYSYGLTAVLMMVVNSIILVYVYKTYGTAILENKSNEIETEPYAANSSPDIEVAFNMDDDTVDVELSHFNLTKRELETLKLAYKGLTNPEIADELSISKHTVKRHMHNIFEKMNVSARLEMVHLVNGIIINKDNLEKR